MKKTTEEQVKNAIKWIDELGTTQAKQGFGELGNEEDGFCCLGFGCAILNIQYEDQEPTSGPFAHRIGLNYDKGDFSGDAVKENHTVIRTLTSLNDNAQWSFKQISDFIKSRPKDLFIPEVGEELAKHYKVQQS